ncbi:clathrin interactor EPSIN 2-like [Hibiscus syriacus]|uniref:Clathrin interactor EPSIN 2-like n=1 Tax=Hibiscus syriacus TaxID=106335 RepID=A0A6A3BR91_HIBSY|nr:clathrin interactor EPSIN 2-like [Hibiscus syriacus]
MGSGILARAVVQAYRQALANAAKSGVTHETLQNAARKAGKAMTEQEARQILGKYDHLFEKNAKVGSFYLQSKVHWAKECLEAAHQAKGEGTSPS